MLPRKFVRSTSFTGPRKATSPLERAAFATALNLVRDGRTTAE
jgi:hypothetical protein